jgi:hypothetical protein
LVAASGASGAQYTLSDSAGNYQLPVDTGAWYVSVLPPSGYWNACEDSVYMYFPPQGDTLALDFSVQTLYECPLLDIDITTPFLRRCADNTYFVRYFNYGTLSAPDARVSIRLDPALSITGATQPYQLSGDSILFDLGEVPWLSGGDFQITAFLACDSVQIGQVHCTEAHIYPDSSCYFFDENWDGAHVDISGYCAGDSVVLTITNTGLDMQDAVGYIITEDQIIFKQSELLLQSQQDTTIVLYPGGATVTLIVQQPEGHPGNSQPMLIIEGCGGDLHPNYSFQFPQNDGDPYTDIECRSNIGSFDPNDKTGLPLGVNGVVSPQTEIEYLIRFQNTGTDTAFMVQILDTLSAYLDPASLIPGAGSHPYRMRISGAGILLFDFSPIALPDSNTNLAASQGFVKYRIKPKIGTPLGAMVENTAHIYFDNNAPVATGTTKHILGNPLEQLSTKTTNPDHLATWDAPFSLSPNPGREHILVTLRQPSESGRLHVKVRNAWGVVVQEQGWEPSNMPALTMDMRLLPAGLYWVELQGLRSRPVVQKFIKI